MAKSETVLDAYVDQEDRVLDPTILEQSALDRMPQPTGWRMLVLPYGGKKTSDSQTHPCLLYTSPSPRDGLLSRMPSSA